MTVYEHQKTSSCSIHDSRQTAASAYQSTSVPWCSDNYHPQFVKPCSSSYDVKACACVPARPEEEAEIKEYAAQPNMLDVVAKQIAPSIFGHADIKKAVACLLFGGARKVGSAGCAAWL